MNFEALVAEYGYAAIGLWVFMEGETSLLVGGAFAQQGLLRLSIVMGIAFTVTLTVDQGVYWLSRKGGQAWLAKRPKLQPVANRVAEWIARYPNLIAIGFRFLYGMRTVALVLIGSSGFPPARFFLLNVIGTALWVATYCGLGFAFGKAAERAFMRLGQHAWWIVAALGLTALLVFLIVKIKRRSLTKPDVL